jgi:hypothetical protein
MMTLRPDLGLAPKKAIWGGFHPACLSCIKDLKGYTPTAVLTLDPGHGVGNFTEMWGPWGLIPRRKVQTCKQYNVI